MPNENLTSRWLVTTAWLADASARTTPSSWMVRIISSDEARCRRRISRRPHSRRGALRHRCDFRPFQSSAPMLPDTRSSPARRAHSASPIAIPSSSMTAPACFRPRGCGGLFACSARRTCSSSPAAFQSGKRKADRSKPGAQACAAPVRGAQTRRRVASLDGVRTALATSRRRSSTRDPPNVSVGDGARAPPGSGPAICRAR